jgi:hypothetical protein
VRGVVSFNDNLDPFFHSFGIDSGRRAGVVLDRRWTALEATKAQIAEATEILHSITLSPQVSQPAFPHPFFTEIYHLCAPQAWNSHGFSVRIDGVMRRSVAVDFRC